MKYYIDMTLIESENLPLSFLWRKVYQQTHEALAEVNTTNSIAFSFPQYKKVSFPLGNILRIFSHSTLELESLLASKKLFGVLDYIAIGEIQEVPDKIEYVQFLGLKPKLTFMERVEEQAKRHNIPIEESFAYFKNSKYATDKTFDLPYVILDSGDTRQTYSLFIKKVLSEKSLSGSFNTFGLSKTATVPWF